jgi:hypothetical protein
VRPSSHEVKGGCSSSKVLQNTSPWKTPSQDEQRFLESIKMHSMSRSSLFVGIDDRMDRDNDSVSEKESCQ